MAPGSAVSLGGELFVDVSISGFHTLLCTFTGVVYASGGNTGGQLLDGTTNNRAFFAAWTNLPAALASSKCVRVFALTSNSYVLTAAGQIIAVGAGDDGQLGRGAAGSSATPAFVTLAANLRVIDFAAGRNEVTGQTHAIALVVDSATNSRLTYCWGSQQSAAMTGVSGTFSSLAAECTYVTSDLKGSIPSAVSASSSHSVVQHGGEFLTWSADGGSGASVFGGYLFGERIDVRSRVFGNEDFVILKSSGMSTTAVYGVLRTGEVYRWAGDYADPVQLNYNGTDPIISIAVGKLHALFLDGPKLKIFCFPLWLSLILFISADRERSRLCPRYQRRRSDWQFPSHQANWV